MFDRVSSRSVKEVLRDRHHQCFYLFQTSPENCRNKETFIAKRSGCERRRVKQGPSAPARLWLDFLTFLLLFKFPSEKDIPSSRIATKECSKLSNAHSDQTEPFRESRRFPETFWIFPIFDFRESRIS